MRAKLAIFDFDGTLADSFPWFLGVVNQLADEHGFRRIEEPEIEALRGQAVRQIIKHLGVPAWKLPGMARQMRRQMATEIHHIALFPGVDRLLRRLARGGIRIAIVTSNTLDNAC